ncbi:UDP-2,4-diacetamido-2,4,6-trideoxy-beta-L-altropyranose hydrolase [Coleofasciculus sp. G2-EDA-02]|uniref:UDP-2,4-diacetamido-2,4, 6-trideoxy-beta-L-altropyranose hydrolase n=1 Tax=Coleofasciculus sp. G2-EDA-02 TaxID=3069529 RepID=UPI0032FEDC19
MNIAIRADASTQIGTGHLMRCLAIAQAWQEVEEPVILVMATLTPALETRLKLESLEVIHLSIQPGSTDDARATVAVVKGLGINWVVVDGYHFGTEYQQILKKAGLSLLFLDDYGHAEHYWADIVLNQNVYADEFLYVNREPYTQLLLGTRYALLRQEFWQWQGWQRVISPVANKILVTLGGGDADNVTLKVIQALKMIETEILEVVVVVGGSNPHYEQLQLAIDLSRGSMRLEKNVTNMPELMAWADVGVVAGGSTSWELAFMGLPSIVLILADNQRPIAETLGEMGVAVNLGWHEDVSVTDIAQAMKRLLLSSGMRAEMARCGQELIDGEGTARVLMHLQNKPLRLRPVRQEDCKLLWEWANDPEVRAASFSSEPIPWEKHLQWFSNKFNDSNCYIFIILDNQDEAIGQVRFQRQDRNQAEMSISLDKNKRCSGYGSRIIDIATKEIFTRTSLQVVYAFIKQTNEISIGAFEKASFKKNGTKTIKGNVAIHYVMFKSLE